MRLILKTIDGYFQICWVTSGKKSILGWFSGDWLRQELNISNDLHFEAHFTFPQDGNFHYSYKSINKNHEEFINVYWNKVKIKTISNGKKTHTEITREEFSDNILGHLVPQYKPDTLDIVKQFHFISINFSVFNGRFKIRKTDISIKDTQIKDTDLLVDVSQMDHASLSINIVIQPSEVIFTAKEPSKVFWKYLTLPNSRTLILLCRINT